MECRRRPSGRSRCGVQQQASVTEHQSGFADPEPSCANDILRAARDGPWQGQGAADARSAVPMRVGKGVVLLAIQETQDSPKKTEHAKIGQLGHTTIVWRTQCGHR
jgi:hypothetical protein